MQLKYNNKKFETCSNIISFTKSTVIYYCIKIKAQAMDCPIPRYMMWQGCGKSRLSTVSFPDVVENDYDIDEEKETKRKHYIRMPISLKYYKKPTPVLVIPKRNNSSE